MDYTPAKPVQKSLQEAIASVMESTSHYSDKEEWLSAVKSAGHEYSSFGTNGSAHAIHKDTGKVIGTWNSKYDTHDNRARGTLIATPKGDAAEENSPYPKNKGMFPDPHH